MKKVIFLLVLLLAPACRDSTLVEPLAGPELDLVVTADRAERFEYAFTGTLDNSECGDCDAVGQQRLTPSGVLHFSGFKNRFVLENGLVGELFIMGAGTINMNNGKGTGSGTLLMELTEPGVGTFECRWHAKWEDYRAPLFAYVEHARYLSCKGSGDFAGSKMKATVDNENHVGEYPAVADGIAVIW